MNKLIFCPVLLVVATGETGKRPTWKRNKRKSCQFLLLKFKQTKTSPQSDSVQNEDDSDVTTQYCFYFLNGGSDFRHPISQDNEGQFFNWRQQLGKTKRQYFKGELTSFVLAFISA